ncbi:protein rep [Magnetospirillum sp. LM-5]|uniref:protein rep n=1 Tax=Magnetospirillum sp. LM-5 TaxID=2681466 RepID=UPI00156F4E3E|nr:protein rep [Magnetospirillum sp. LM-5]
MRRSSRRLVSAVQDVAARLLPAERVAGCGRRPNGSAVAIHVQDGRGVVVGLQTCGSVWLCPCCGRVVSGQRRAELNRLLAWARRQGLQVVMMTRTVRHHRAMALDWLLWALRAATKRFYQSSDWRAIKGRIAGHVTATECPCGPNGFHPHTHTILLVRAESEAEAVALLGGLRTAWERALAKEGLDCNDHGFDVRGHAGTGDYIAKWGVAEELTFSQAKDDSNPRQGRTPWQLLAIVAGLRRDSLLSPQVARLRWLEFARAIKGRRQLVWSRGLKDRAGITERSDEDIATDPPELSPDTEIGRLSAPEWRTIVRRGLRVVLLERVEAEGRAGFEAVRRLALAPPQRRAAA